MHPISVGDRRPTFGILSCCYQPGSEAPCSPSMSLWPPELQGRGGQLQASSHASMAFQGPGLRDTPAASWDQGTELWGLQRRAWPSASKCPGTSEVWGRPGHQGQTSSPQLKPDGLEWTLRPIPAAMAQALFWLELDLGGGPPLHQDLAAHLWGPSGYLIAISLMVLEACSYGGVWLGAEGLLPIMRGPIGGRGDLADQWPGCQAQGSSPSTSRQDPQLSSPQGWCPGEGDTRWLHCRCYC